MKETVDRESNARESSAKSPRFGSYIGLFYSAVILSILAFAVLHASGTTQAFDALRPGMTTTEVAAALGSPRAESRQGDQVVQTWSIPDGSLYEVRFREGKLVAKERRKEASRAR